MHHDAYQGYPVVIRHGVCVNSRSLLCNMLILNHLGIISVWWWIPIKFCSVASQSEMCRDISISNPEFGKWWSSYVMGRLVDALSYRLEGEVWARHPFDKGWRKKRSPLGYVSCFLGEGCSVLIMASATIFVAGKKSFFISNTLCVRGLWDWPKKIRPFFVQ